MIESYILEIDKDIEKDLFHDLLNCTSADKKERISRLRMFEDAQRSLLGDMLARYAICKRLCVRNGDLIFGINAYGKPVLINRDGAHSGVHFNISHSGKYVACAVDDNPVGIDVETIKNIDLKIAKRFFSQEEYSSLMNQPEEMRLKYFFIIWTLKESYVKAEGKGLGIPLNSFSIRTPDFYGMRISDRHAGILKSNSFPPWNMDLVGSSISKGGTAKKYYFYQSFLDDDAVCALCALDDYQGKTAYFTVKEFLREANAFL